MTRLTVPTNPPVEQYWSVTAYDRQAHALIEIMSRASRSSQIPDMRKNADGSIDVVRPARAGRQGSLYGPKKELFDKAWKLPDVEKVAEAIGARQ